MKNVLAQLAFIKPLASWRAFAETRTFVFAVHLGKHRVFIVPDSSDYGQQSACFHVSYYISDFHILSFVIA